MNLLSDAAMAIIKRHAARIESPFDLCHPTSTALAKALYRSGEAARVIQFAGLKTPAPDADVRWLSLPPRHWSHYAVLLGDIVVDLTWRQFFPLSPTPYVAPLDEVRSNWDRSYL